MLLSNEVRWHSILSLLYYKSTKVDFWHQRGKKVYISSYIADYIVKTSESSLWTDCYISIVWYRSTLAIIFHMQKF